MSLEDIRKRLPDTNWRHGTTYEQSTIASELNLTLTEFLSLSEEDKAYAVATRRTKLTIEAYEQKLSEERSERDSKNRNRKRGRKGR